MFNPALNHSELSCQLVRKVIHMSRETGSNTQSKDDRSCALCKFGYAMTEFTLYANSILLCLKVIIALSITKIKKWIWNKRTPQQLFSCIESILSKKDTFGTGTKCPS